MATENKFDSLFEREIEMSDNENNNEKLPITLFKEIEIELLDSLLHNNGNDSDDETDGP